MNSPAKPAHSRVARNTAALTIAQVLSYFFPLLLSPYLIRILGLTGYGTVALAHAICGYFATLTDWGFGFSATRQISVARSDPAKLSRIFFEVILAKLVLCLSSYVLLVILIVTVPSLKLEGMFLLAANLFTVANVLQPNWYFQGVERLSVAATLQVAGRTMGTAIIFLMVRSANDVLKTILIQTITAVIIAFVGFAWATSQLPKPDKTPSLHGAYQQIKQGLDSFCMMASLSLYTLSNTVFLGLLAGKAEVVFFSLPEKISRAASDVIGTYGQALFPAVEHALSTNKAKGIALIKRSSLILLSAGAAATVLLAVSARTIVPILYGSQLQTPVFVLILLSPLPLLLACTNILGIQTMIPQGFGRRLWQIILIAGILNIILLVNLTPKYGAKGAAISVIVSETLVALATAYQVYTKRLLKS